MEYNHSRIVVRTTRLPLLSLTLLCSFLCSANDLVVLYESNASPIFFSFETKYWNHSSTCCVYHCPPSFVHYFADGATVTLTGHPLDTVKSKMQVQSGFTHLNAIQTAKKICHDEGMRGFYRGAVPPLWGSAVYRGIQISGYEYAYTWLEMNTASDSLVKTDLGWGLRPMVPLASVFSASLRVCLESPIEYAKLMGQTGSSWKLRDVYRGFHWQLLRTTALITPIYVAIDCFRRKTDFMKSLTGNFCVMFSASVATYAVLWPLETMKNLSQSGKPHVGASVPEKIKFLGGARGLLRGIWPGSLGGGLRNGAGLVVIVLTQSWLTKLGFRQW